MARLTRIADLVDAGLTIEGIRIVLDLEDENERLRREIATLRAARRKEAAQRG